MPVSILKCPLQQSIGMAHQTIPSHPKYALPLLDKVGADRRQDLVIMSLLLLVVMLTKLCLFSLFFVSVFTTTPSPYTASAVPAHFPPPPSNIEATWSEDLREGYFGHAILNISWVGSRGMDHLGLGGNLLKLCTMFNNFILVKSCIEIT